MNDTDARERLAERVVLVLNETQDLVNVAGTVRAMMNTGLRRLRLVRPAEYDERRITGIAHGAEIVLERIEFPATLDAAIAGAQHVVGTTARRRSMRHAWEHPRDAAPELLALAAEGDVVIVFGREDSGLSNEELDLCDRILTVPTDPERPSLNLAQAVLLVGYELWLAGPGSERPLPRPRRHAPRASSAQLRAAFDAMAGLLDRTGFHKKKNPEVALRTLRAIYRRARLDAREASLLRAIALRTTKYIDWVKRGEAD